MEDIYDDEEGLRIESRTEQLDDNSQIVIFKIIGSIDTHTCSIHMLDNVITQKVNEPQVKAAIFNFSELDHINSTGIGFMIRLGDTCRKEKNSHIIMTNVDREQYALFDMLGLWDLFRKSDSDEEAMEKLRATITQVSDGSSL